MTDQDSLLKLQAFMDGELSVRETAEVKAWLERDPEARALLAELRNTTSILTGNETEYRLPETREFFWSKIEREITRQSQSQPERQAISRSWFAWLRGHLMPVSGVALIVCLVSMLAIRPGHSAVQFGEMELASDDMSSYTYRDQQQKMTMVWLSDRSSEDSSQFTDKTSVDTVAPE